jgi:cytochrome c biogenesis protein CcdA
MMPRRVKLSLVLCLASVAVAAVFLTVTQDSWLRTVGGVLLLFIALVQVSLTVRESLTEEGK